MKTKLCLVLLMLLMLNGYSQEKKLPEGWDRILLEGKVAYMNLVTGSVSKRYPQRPAVKPEEEIVKEFDPTVVHIVKKGETLSLIAKKYGLGLAKMYQLNSMTNFDSLEVGKEIVIGYAHNDEEKEAFLNGDFNALNHEHHDHGTNTKSEVAKSSSKFHTVANGETLYRVAKLYKLSVKKLKSLNNLKKNAIFIGQRLKIN
ncbi:MAG: LysM peptidoglycan-binding domain-containing protein [Tenacibaculum sp.]